MGAGQGAAFDFKVGSIHRSAQGEGAAFDFELAQSREIGGVIDGEVPRLEYDEGAEIRIDRADGRIGASPGER